MMTLAQVSKSAQVIEKRIAVLNEQVEEAEGAPSEYEKEIEELKELLPEIREEIEEAKESQRSGNVAELARKAVLGDNCTSGFTLSAEGTSVSETASRKPTDGASSSNYVTDFSHLVRKKRKPEEESQTDGTKKAIQALEAENQAESQAAGEAGAAFKREQSLPPKGKCFVYNVVLLWGILFV
ncbi:hypothetical protein mRhiFer1_009876 [Rhinolophus ferrumequinum]|uniref:Nuclear autoantigenic sperm protein n=1 Tax=Rhinolophus ferrumequinum TaxID=59479 RepID=A0A7J7YSE8_RHIFE|nr:hypothetical protein mRhiFer1_009876 [Rhinolophus ferrumequinum]